MKIGERLDPSEVPEPPAAPEPAGLTYTRLTGDDKTEILEGRLRQLEAEHFNHSTNLVLAETTGSAEAARQSKQALVIIEGVHAQIVAQLKDLGG